jgi:hypothetical protein
MRVILLCCLSPFNIWQHHAAALLLSVRVGVDTPWACMYNHKMEPSCVMEKSRSFSHVEPGAKTQIHTHALEQTPRKFETRFQINKDICCAQHVSKQRCEGEYLFLLPFSKLTLLFD